jgi:hypothetical protein
VSRLTAEEEDADLRAATAVETAVVASSSSSRAADEEERPKEGDEGGREGRVEKR